MGKVSQIFLAGTVLAVLGLPGAPGPAKSEPEMRLAQAPLTPEQQKELQRRKQQQAPPQAQPPRPPAAQPPRPPAPPPQAAPRPPQIAPPPRPAQSAPPPPPPGPRPVERPVQSAPPSQQFQRPAQGGPQPPAGPGELRRPPQNAPAQVAPSQQFQRPAQGGPPQPVPGQQLHPLQNAPAQLAPTGPGGGPAMRPAQGEPPRHMPPPALPAPTAAQMQPVRPTGGPAAMMPATAQGQPVRRVDQLRTERHESVEGNRTIFREPDRVIVRENDGRFFIRHSETDRFRYGARDVHMDRRGNDNVTTIVLPNGERVVSVVDPDGRLLRRSRFLADGREIIIIDQREPRPDYDDFVELPPLAIGIPRERYIVDAEDATPEMMYDALVAPPLERLDRPYTLDEIRFSPALRERMPRIDIDSVNFEFGSWEVAPDQVDRLAGVADAIGRAISRNPREVFLIEGHTDAVGSDVDNLSLSDRRAETVALILSDKFGVPPENLVTQGYGKQYLKIPTDGPERRNRRVTVRRITPLLAGGQ